MGVDATAKARDCSNNAMGMEINFNEWGVWFGVMCVGVGGCVVGTNMFDCPAQYLCNVIC